jgi:hypothetical protein
MKMKISFNRCSRIIGFTFSNSQTGNCFFTLPLEKVDGNHHSIYY